MFNHRNSNNAILIHIKAQIILLTGTTFFWFISLDVVNAQISYVKQDIKTDIPVLKPLIKDSPFLTFPSNPGSNTSDINDYQPIPISFSPKSKLILERNYPIKWKKISEYSDLEFSKNKLYNLEFTGTYIIAPSLF